MLKIFIIASVIQIILSSLYSLSCILREIGYYFESKYGDYKSADEIEQEDIEMAKRVLKKTFLPIFDEAFKLFLLFDLIMAVIYWLFV